MGEKLQSLSLLASKDAAGAKFFEVASRALVTGLGCRWAGFGKLGGSRNDIDILAFCDSGALGPCFSYSLDDSPCGEVYKREPEDPFCEFPDDVTSLFTGPKVLKQIGAWSYRGEAIFDPNGTPLAHVFTIHDKPMDWAHDDVAFFRMVAQRAGAEYNRLQAEAALIAAKDRAEASDRAKTEFLTNTSHELRTPLNSIIGLSELLESVGTANFPPEDVQKFLGEIRKSGTNLLGMIEDLLDISRIELGYVELDEIEITLSECFEHTAEALSGILIKQDIRLDTHSEKALAVFADIKALSRILVNLVGNAAKFSPAGSTVTLAAEVMPAGNLAITVSDQGIGIADSDLEKVLSYFGQVEGGLVSPFAFELL